MSNIPTFEEIVQVVERLPLSKRRKAPQGRKPTFSDSFIIALAVYQKLASFRHAQKMLAVMMSLGVKVPAVMLQQFLPSETQIMRGLRNLEEEYGQTTENVERRAQRSHRTVGATWRGQHG